jgi:hypothetical protein
MAANAQSSAHFGEGVQMEDERESAGAREAVKARPLNLARSAQQQPR